ncbi:MAG TPA: PAS domain S-box protein [Longimicrobiales bacterium]|nr:PAS domain S-box protein [Longimicrobiales bacterium]
MNRLAPPAGTQPVEADPAFFRSLVENSAEATAVLDPEGRIHYANPAAQRLLGIGTADGAGRSLLDFIHPADLERARLSVESASRSSASPGSAEEVRVARPGGGYLWTHCVLRRLPGGPAAGELLVQFHDITPRRKAEARLRAAELHLRRVVDQLPIVLFEVDAYGILTLAEGRAMTALAMRPEAMVGRNVFELYGEDDPAMVPIRQGLAGQAVRSRTELAGRVWDTQVAPVRDVHGMVTGVTGVTLDVTDAARQERAAAFQALLLDSVGQAVVAADPDGQIIYWNHGAETQFGWSRDEAIGRNVRELVPEGVQQEDPESLLAGARRGESWSGDYLIRRKDGEVIPVLLSNRPVIENGEVVAIIAVSSDLREMKRLERQLRGAQKMEAVGQLAGGIAHDFNNLLATIGGYAGMAAERVLDRQLASDISEIVRATERAKALVDELLAFGSRSRVSLQTVDVNQTVRAMLAVIRRALPRGARLEAELADDTWPVRSDPARLEQALINLVVNAGEAMPEGGRVTIRTDNVALGPGAVSRLDEPLPEGAYVRLIVQDTGVGMDAAVLGRIFEPFFTTKEVGKGTGLGLSTVFGVMRSLEGGIEVESEPGQGTRFYLYLPRSHDAADAATLLAAPLPDPTPRPARILLVEDEPAVRRLARRILERDGHSVTEAANGAEALHQVEQGADPDLVVTDVIMPEMGGGELADRVRELQPGIRVLFMSGYTADELKDRGIESTTAFLPKPFAPALLLTRVREALDAMHEPEARKGP